MTSYIEAVEEQQRRGADLVVRIDKAVTKLRTLEGFTRSMAQDYIADEILEACRLLVGEPG